MKSLFLGGPADGEWHETRGEDYRMVAKMPDLRAPPVRMPSYEDITDHRYVRVPFNAGGSMTYIYLHDSIAQKAQGSDERAELALHKLLSGYQPKKEDEQRRRPSSGPSTGDVKSSDLRPISREEFETRLKKAMTEAPKFEVQSEPRTAMEQAMLQQLSEKTQAQASLQQMVAQAQRRMGPGCDCPICTTMRKIERGEQPSGSELMELLEFLSELQKLEQFEQNRAARAVRPARLAESIDEEYYYKMKPEAKIAKREEVKILPKRAFDHREQNKAPTSVRKGKR